MDCNSLLSYQLYFLLKTEHFTYYNVVTVKIRFSSPSPQVLLLYFMIYKSSIFKLFNLFLQKLYSLMHVLTEISFPLFKCYLSQAVYWHISLLLLNLFKLKPKKQFTHSPAFFQSPVSCNRQSVLFIWTWYFWVLFLDSTLSYRHYSLFSKALIKIINVQLKKDIHESWKRWKWLNIL